MSVSAPSPVDATASEQLLYRRLAASYREAIESGSLRPGDRMPSLRALMRLHRVSLSTALQVCRLLEDQGWLEARPRAGYFVRRPARRTLAGAREPEHDWRPDEAQFVGIHATVSAVLALGMRHREALNLGSATAASGLYPTEILKKGVLRCLRQHPELLTTPGAPEGNALFRSVVARRALAAGVTVSPEEVIPTRGNREGLNLALRAVAEPGDTVAVESPAFFGLLQVLESLGLRALEIPTSPRTGISLDALELAFASVGRIRAVVVVPNLQNPLGSIMPDTHKARLVALCARAGAALIEDDFYRDTVSGGGVLRAAKAWDRSDNVIYCASFNKTVAPGMLLGWMCAGRWDERVRMLKHAQSRHADEWSQIALAEFMAGSAYDRHLQQLRERLREQRERMAEAVAACFPAGTRLSVPRGGMGLWVELPGRLSSRTVFERALEQGIRIAPGAMFSNGGRCDHFIRIGCGLPYTAQVDAAVHRLGAVVAAQLEMQEAGAAD